MSTGTDAPERNHLTFVGSGPGPVPRSIAQMQPRAESAKNRAPSNSEGRIPIDGLKTMPETADPPTGHVSSGVTLAEWS